MLNPDSVSLSSHPLSACVLWWCLTAVRPCPGAQAKQAEVASISELLRTPVTRARLARWLADNQGLLEAAGQQLTG